MAGPEPLIIADTNLLPLPDGQRFYLDDSMFSVDRRGRSLPYFTIAEAAKMFFGQTVEWMRWRIREGYFMLDLDGKRVAVGDKRDEITGFRYFTLADIEKMAHALGQVTGGFNGQQVSRTVLLAKTCAEVYGYL
jgi:hypothetical protein